MRLHSDGWEQAITLVDPSRDPRIRTHTSLSCHSQRSEPRARAGGA